MAVKLAPQLFRVIAKKAEEEYIPEYKTVGSNTVLNINLAAKYSNRDKEEPIIYQGAIWGDKAKEYSGHLRHGDYLILEGDLIETPNQNSTKELRLKPYSQIRINPYSIDKVSRERIVPESATEETSDVRAAKVAAANVVPQDLDNTPF